MGRMSACAIQCQSSNKLIKIIAKRSMEFAGKNINYAKELPVTYHQSIFDQLNWLKKYHDTNKHTHQEGIILSFEYFCTYLLSVSDSTCSLLSVPTSKLISNLRCLGGSHTNLTELVALLVDCHHHLIYNTSLCPPHEHTAIPLGISPGCSLKLK